MTIPFHLSALGYKPDPKNPLRFLPPPDKEFFYPVEFDDALSKTSEDCIKEIARYAYEAGVEAGMEVDLSDPGLTDAERI
jgi:hypothetical protein